MSSIGTPMAERESYRAGYDAACRDVAAWLLRRLESPPRHLGACVTVNLDGFDRAFPSSREDQAADLGGYDG